MKTLAESLSYRIDHAFEAVFVVDKRHGTEQQIADHYGDPSCAVIAADETWFAVGGEGVTLFDFERGAQEFFRPGSPPNEDVKTPWFVHAMRRDGDHGCRILFSPWDDYASVWRLRVPDCRLAKLRDGPSLKDEPYREDVDF